MCIANAFSAAPTRICRFSSTMVKAVLRVGSTVEIDYNFEAGLTCPIDGCVEIRSGTLCVWTPWLYVAPVLLTLV